MQKINKIVFTFLISLHIISCGGGFKYTKIFEDKEHKIFYINSKKIGERVKSTLIVDNKTFEYNIYIGYKGLPIHIIRYTPQNSNTKSESRLDIYREMEFLVTDTSKNYPNYLNNGTNVNDYYDPPFFKGGYEVEKLKKKVSPVLAKEYEMLQKIKSVLVSKQVEFQAIDSAKIIGWFKYEF